MRKASKSHKMNHKVIENYHKQIKDMKANLTSAQANPILPANNARAGSYSMKSSKKNGEIMNGYGASNTGYRRKSTSSTRSSSKGKA